MIPYALSSLEAISAECLDGHLLPTGIVAVVCIVDVHNVDAVSAENLDGHLLSTCVALVFYTGALHNVDVVCKAVTSFACKCLCHLSLVWPLCSPVGGRAHQHIRNSGVPVNGQFRDRSNRGLLAVHYMTIVSNMKNGCAISPRDAWPSSGPKCSTI